MISLNPGVLGIRVSVDSSWNDSDLGLELGIFVVVGGQKTPVGGVDVTIVARDGVSSDRVFAFDGWSEV